MHVEIDKELGYSKICIDISDILLTNVIHQVLNLLYLNVISPLY